MNFLFDALNVQAVKRSLSLIIICLLQVFSGL